MKRIAFLIICFLFVNSIYSQDKVLIDKAIDKGKAFLQKEFKAGTISYDGLMFLPFLQKQFNFEIIKQIEIEKFLKKHKSEHPLDALALKIVDVNYSVSEGELSGINNEEVLLIRTIYPNLFQKSTIEDLKNMANQDGYYLTHGLLGLKFLQENNLISNFNEISTPYKNKFKSLILNESISLDARIEAIAFALYFGWKELISENEINLIIKTQQPDGGWKEIPKNELSSSHTAILALWALLESQNTNKPLTILQK